MPTVPKFLADFIEPRFSQTVEVSEVTLLAPRFLRVCFRADCLKQQNFTPGQVVEFRVSDTAFRHYTPSRWCRDHGLLEVLFFLHGQGPGSAWASSLSPGQTVQLMGPGGRFFLRDAKTHVFLGDETTIGLFSCLARDADETVLGAIETEAGATNWPLLGRLELSGIERLEKRGASLLKWLQQNQPPAHESTHFYLAGHAATIALLRRWIRAQRWSRKQIHTYPYWADGKRGL